MAFFAMMWTLTVKLEIGILRDGQVPCGCAADDRIGNDGNDFGERRAFVSRGDVVGSWAGDVRKM